MLSWLKRNLKRLVGITPEKRCPVCSGTGLNCYTCDDDGVPETMHARAVCVVAGEVLFMHCDVDRCYYCGGRGRVPADSGPACPMAKCMGCNQAYGEFRTTPIPD